MKAQHHKARFRRAYDQPIRIQFRVFNPNPRRKTRWFTVMTLPRGEWHEALLEAEDA